MVDALVSGGAEKQLALLLAKLPTDQFEMTVLAFEDGPWRPRFERPGVCVRVIPYGHGKIAALAYTARAIRRSQPDVVHTFGHSSNYVGRAAAIIAGTPVIIASERSAPAHVKNAGARIAVERVLGWRTDYLVANSSHAARFYVDHRLVPPARVKVIRNGIELPPAPRPLRVRAEQFTVATVGDFRPEKNLGDLIDAFMRLLARLGDVTLHIIGDGTARGAAEREVGSRGIADRVIFHGYVEDVVGLLGSVDVYAHTAKYEGLPNAVMEAMALGLPVVAFDAAWSQELIGLTGTGLIVPMGDIDALAGAIEAALTDAGLAQRLGHRGREFVEAELSVERMVSDTIALYPSEWLGPRRRRALARQ